MMYPDAVLKGNRYSNKESRIHSPGGQLSARESQKPMSSSKNKRPFLKKKKSDMNPLKNKALSNRNEKKKGIVSPSKYLKLLV